MTGNAQCRLILSIATILFLGFMPARAQQAPDPHQVPVMDGEAGPCSVSFIVTDVKGTPVYDARIKVHIAYGFAGVRRLDLEAATNVDGKTEIKGLPKKVKGEVLYFNAMQGNLRGTYTYDPVTSCDSGKGTIILTESATSPAAQ